MSERQWMSVKREYEGYPLFLRYPVNLDYNKLQAKFPVRVVITHTFSFRRFDGAPESAYNETLEEFDHAAVSLFNENDSGCVVLVETFGGKRIYYYYAMTEVEPKAVFDKLQSRYRNLKLELDVTNDPSWRFIRRYSAEFFSEV